VHLSWLDPMKVRRLALVGSQRMAIFDDMDPEARLQVHDKAARAPSPEDPPGARQVHAGERQVVKVAWREPLRIEVEAFLKSVRTGVPIPTPGEDGARVVEVLEAAERSLAGRGGPVRVGIR
jgi:predicted dehydrogenase